MFRIIGMTLLSGFFGIMAHGNDFKLFFYLSVIFAVCAAFNIVFLVIKCSGNFLGAIFSTVYTIISRQEENPKVKKRCNVIGYVIMTTTLITVVIIRHYGII